MSEPVRPSSLSEYAERTLAALAAANLGHVISVGGAIGLLHYLDHRKTNEVDAWWASTSTSEHRERVLATVESTLRPFGEVHTRQWGEVVSLDWKLWRERQRRAGSDTDPSRARLAVETHLARISQHRPLEAISDPEQRTEAEAVRSWFTQELFHAKLD